MKSILSVSSVLLFLLAHGMNGCSTTTKPVHAQRYAKLKNQRDYEYEFYRVWNGIEAALKNHAIVERDPDEVNEAELRQLKERTLETDWIYGRSEDKFVNYRVNDLPKKKYLNTRYKFNITAKSQIGATNVSIETTEEIENLDEDGNPAGWESSQAIDSRKAHQLLDQIKLAILSSD